MVDVGVARLLSAQLRHPLHVRIRLLHERQKAEHFHQSRRQRRRHRVHLPACTCLLACFPVDYCRARACGVVRHASLFALRMACDCALRRLCDTVTQVLGRCADGSCEHIVLA